MELIYKWGCNGSHQQQYKQIFEDTSESDAYIFLSSIVLLRLYCTLNEKIVWQNSTPSSPRFCRPIRIRFVKETAEIIREEIDYIQKQIDSLEPLNTEQNREIIVKHTMAFTMVDGKVCNAATNTKSTIKCYICGATSKNFNNLSKKNEVNEESLGFGLFILHARIRLFESLLHLSYKLEVQTWQVRSEKDKQLVKDRNDKIQKDFRDKMGLIVDVPKPGFGNSNDGNTSRRFFDSPDLVAEITGLDMNFIDRIKIILEVLSSGYTIDIKKFKTYTAETAQNYVELYSWHPMTPTMHKILIHGPLVVEKALLPIGQMSEEAAEARNKHFRNYRQNYARKCSRKSCNMDVINRLLLSSDPLLSSIRSKPPKRNKTFSKESLEMLVAPCIDKNFENDKLSDLESSSDEDI